MTNDITAGSFVTVTQTNQDSENRQNRQTVLPSDSFRLVSKITNSSRLSDTEKNGLISNVALIDRYATGGLRTKLLNNVTATTLFLERGSGARTPEPAQQAAQNNVADAIRQVRQVQQSAPPPSSNEAELQRQVENVQRRVEAVPRQTRNTSLQEVNQQVPRQDVEQVLTQPIDQVARESNVNVRQVPTLAESRAQQAEDPFAGVRDNVVLSQSARTVQDLTLPGQGNDSREIPLPGQGSSQADIPLPGQGGENIDIPVLGSGEFEEIPLPGQGGNEQVDVQAEIAARIAELESRDIPELPLPGGVNVEELAAQITAAPEQALDSIGEVILPGQGEAAGNASVNERAARVALSV